MKMLILVYKKIKKTATPAFYNYTLLTLLAKPLRKWVTNTVAANCPFNAIRIFLYRLCGFKIGKKCFIGMRCYLDDMCYDMLEIGNHVTISYGVFFACHGHHQNHLPITISDHAYIGMRANIISKSDNNLGITIGKHAVIGACTLVNKNIPSYSTAVGVPCRILDNNNHI